MTVAPDRPRLAFADVEEATAAVRAAGHRMTVSRRVVLEALFAADGPVSAQAIADGLGGRVPPSDVASVYRNLETLEAIGIVRHVHAGHGAGLYGLDRAEVEYLTCSRCHRVTPVDPAVLDGARAAIQEATGYVARFAHFPVHGLCEECARERSGG